MLHHHSGTRDICEFNYVQERLLSDLYVLPIAGASIICGSLGLVDRPPAENTASA